MKKLLCLLILLAVGALAEAQTFKFPVDTLIKTGPLKRRINVVILPDGYTEADMPKFKTDANSYITYLLTKPPFDKYKAYFNFYTITVPSAESGISHPGNANDEDPKSTQPVETKNTYFGSTFDVGKIHRLVAITKASNFTNVMATNFPAYDLAFMITNTIYYGGSGGNPSTFTTNGSANEIGVHEMGHTFVNLADEYWPGGGREVANMSADKNPLTNRWRNWLNTPNIDIFDHSSPGQIWAKPSKGTCRMEFLNKEFCNVCREGFVEKILSLVGPIEGQLPTENAVVLGDVNTTFSLNLLKPIPNSLQVEWFLDGKSISGQEQVKLSAASMPNPTAKLLAAVYDSTYFSRNTGRKLKPYTVEWTLSRGSVEPFQISANKTTICAGDSVVFTSKGCAGTITWSNGAKGSSITVKPASGTTYSATCDIAGVAAGNSVSIIVNPTPVAVATNKGPYVENQTIELMGSGGGSYEWKGPAGFVSTAQNPTIANAKVANSGLYSLTVSVNNCLSTASTAVIVSSFTTKISDISPRSVCPNAQISVTFTTEGVTGNGNKFGLQLSNAQGTNYQDLATTTEGNTLKATIPASTPAGTGYKVRITTGNPPSLSEPSAISVTVKPLPTAAFESTVPLNIQQYSSAEVKINLTGDAPWKMSLSDGKTYDAASSPASVSLMPNATTDYTLTSVSNICGNGTVSNAALKITVSPVLSVGAGSILDNTAVYPNPTNESVTVRFDKSTKGEKSIELIDNQGIVLAKKAVAGIDFQLSLSEFPAGTYFLRLRQGTGSIIKKIVKQ